MPACPAARVATYASEINRQKTLVAKLQRVQLGKGSEKLRKKRHARQVRLRSASAPCRKRWLRGRVNSMTRYPRSRCDSLSSENPCRPRFPAKPARCRRQKLPARRVAVSSVRRAATCQGSWSSSAAPLRLSERSGRSRPAVVARPRSGGDAVRTCPVPLRRTRSSGSGFEANNRLLFLRCGE